MRSFKTGRGITVACCSVVAALSIPAGAEASAAPKPRAVTGGATHVLSSSAQLNGAIDPDGVPASYFFQYGLSLAYGQQTPTVGVGSGTTAVKVGQPVAGLTPGAAYHYRIVAVYGAGQLVLGRDRTFTPKVSPLKIELTKIGPVTVGTSFLLRGALSGLAVANRAVILQASPFPYLQAFTPIGIPARTDAFGRFAFRVANLTSSSQFRALTVGLRPTYSPVLKVGAAPRVTFHARSSRVGLVRLYGTVSPPVVGARVYIQVEKAVRPGPKSTDETARRFVTQFVTRVKRATRTTARFSMIVRVRHGGRYRAYVRLRPGRLVSGYSTQTVRLHTSKTKR